DGRMLKNPDLIHPGWVMRLPADAKGPGLKVVDHGAESGPAADDSAGQVGGGDAEGAAGGAEANTTRGAAGAAGTAAREQTTGRDDVESADASADAADSTSRAPLYGVAGGLLAAGLLFGLRRRRAALGPGALWSARTDPTPDGPGGPGGGPGGVPPRPGAALRDEAEPATARWLDSALRSWATSGSGSVPVPSTCTLSRSGL